MESKDCPECRYWYGLTTLPGLGRTLVARLVKRFGSARAAWEAHKTQWMAVKGFGPRVTGEALTARSDERLNREMRRLDNHSVQLLCPRHPFPPRLQHIHDHPLLLYVKGTLLPSDARAVAIVGSRKPSAHAIDMAGTLASSLASVGITVVSGLAAGVDAAAHKGALAAGGRTIAVTGSGLDTIYPPSHANLAAEIEHRGALVTEYPLGSEPAAGHFPMRNRLIAGWAMAVVVVEAPERSGALITAYLALDEGRDVLVVPGDGGRPSCVGSNRLLGEGAGVVLTANDVIFAIREELRADMWTSPNRAEARHPDRTRESVPDELGATSAGVRANLSETEGLVLTLLGHGGVRRAEGLVAKTGRSVAEVQRALFRLELVGLVRKEPTGEYVRVRGVTGVSAG